LEEWESLSVDPENRYAYEMRLKWLLDQLTNIRSEREAIEEGWKKGLEQGKQEGLKEGVKHLVRTMATKDIAHLTDLTEEEVRGLLKGNGASD
jgi:predicted transposase/invertase (TIGR01784 family)